MAHRRRRWRDVRPEEDRVRVNKAIRAPEVRVVNDDGQQLGVMPVDAARDIAGRIGLDLVEISPNASPPVCKIMDYGRYKFEAKKKAASAKRTQHQTQIKEVKFRPRIDDHDRETKLKNARKFLFQGHKVKATVMFRGREIVHSHLGRQLLERVTEEIAEIAAPEGHPSMEGRTLSVTFAPNRTAIDKIKAEEAKRAAAEGREVEPDEPDDLDAEEMDGDEMDGDEMHGEDMHGEISETDAEQKAGETDA